METPQDLVEDSSEFNQEKYLEQIREKVKHLFAEFDAEDEDHIRDVDLDKFPQHLADELQKAKDGLDEAERDCNDTLWKKEKMTKLTNR